MAETAGVSELSHGGEHRRGGCKGEKRLNKRVGVSFIWSWLQGEPRSGGQRGGGVKREEAERSVPHEETAVRVSAGGLVCGYVLRTSWAVRSLRFDDQEAAEPFKRAAE